METLLNMLTQALAADLPGIGYDLDAAQSPTGASWIGFKDSPLAGVSVEVRPSEGYGLHSAFDDPGFGGPDKVRASASEIIDDLKAINASRPA